MFENLNEDDRIALANVVDELKVPEGHMLFEAGDHGDSLFIVRVGQIELFIKDTVGQKIVLHAAQQRWRSWTVKCWCWDRDDLILLFQRKPEAALNMLASLSGLTRKADELLRIRVSRNVNEEMEVQSTLLQRIADWIAWFSGSMAFLMINGGWFIVWIIINTFAVGIAAFDPYPFGLLTMIVSLEAIFLSCFVLISQNRQAEKDRVRSDIEYEVNIKAELEIGHLHEKTDRIYENMMARFSNLEKQMGLKITRLSESS